MEDLHPPLEDLPRDHRVAVLEILVEVLHQTVGHSTPQEVASTCLEAALRLTGSQYGFIGKVNERGLFDTLVISPMGWEKCNQSPDKTPTLLQDMLIQGIWSIPLKTGEPFTTGHIEHRVLPEGHPPIHTFLGIPLQRGEEPWGVLALANKSGEYTPEDIGAVSVIGQVTLEALQRVLAEQNLQASEVRFARLYDMIPLGVAIYKAVDDGEDFVFLDVNPAVEHIENIPRESLVGRRVTACFPGIAEMGLLDVFRRVWHTGEMEYHPISYYKDGQRKGWRDNRVFRLPTGEVVALYEDVTAKKKAEDKLHHLNEHLKRSNEELEQFAYAASHDLREPLNKITSFGQRLEARFGDDMDPKALEYLGVMIGASERLRGLVTDLLHYSRAGRDLAPLMDVPLHKVVLEVMDDLSESIMETGAQIQSISLPEVRGHSHQLRMVFQNLISNAIKFRKPGEPPTIEIKGEYSGRHAIVTVRDNGIGFDPKFNEEIFRIFHRLHSRFEIPGTGIGLALCRRVINRYGGTIEADGKPGEGATFRLTLPLSTSLDSS